MRQYSFDRISLSWTGLDLTPGLAEGTSVTIRLTNPTWTQRFDGLGGTIRLFNADRSGECDILVNSESKTHQQLLALALSDRLTRAIQAPLYMKDSSTKERFLMTNAYLLTTPDEIRANTSVDVTWTFAYTSFDHQPNVGNNNLVGT